MKKESRKWITKTPDDILKKMIQYKLTPGYSRPSFEDTLAKMLVMLSERSSCLFYNVGAIIYQEKQLLAIGYNGSVAGDDNSDEVGCRRIVGGQLVRGSEDLCRGSHAERNAISNAAINGVAIRGSSMLVTFRPCYDCAKQIVNTGIVKVRYLIDYDRDDGTDQFFKKLNIKFSKYESGIFNEWFDLYKETFWI